MRKWKGSNSSEADADDGKVRDSGLGVRDEAKRRWDARSTFDAKDVGLGRPGRPLQLRGQGPGTHSCQVVLEFQCFSSIDYV